jgi:hypothetical protein
MENEKRMGRGAKESEVRSGLLDPTRKQKAESRKQKKRNAEIRAKCAVEAWKISEI